jgi:hypothetical protein
MRSRHGEERSEQEEGEADPVSTGNETGNGDKTQTQMYYDQTTHPGNDWLPVYKAAASLMQEMERSSWAMKREFRHTLGQRLREEIGELQICIYRANIYRDKAPYIITARERIEVIRIKLGLLNDLNQVPPKSMTSAMLTIESIAKQLAAWHKSIKEAAKEAAKETA